MEYLIVKWLHILSATFLFGTGLGSAFYMFYANRSGNIQAISVVAARVVIADWLFTAPTVIFQPLSGLYLAHQMGVPWSQGWVKWSLALYVLAGACWLPVVWLQIRMRDIARVAAIEASTTLSPLYWRYARIWTALGVPAFVAMIVIYYLMVVKPA